MNQSLFIKISWLFIFLVQLLLFFLCVSSLTDVQILGMYFNTDYLYLPSLFRDIFVDGNSIKGWSITPAPYFFPDMFLYFLIYSIVDSIPYTAIVYGFIQLVLVQIFFRKILILILDDTGRANLLALSGCLFLQLFLVAGALNNEAFTTHLIITSAAHLGVALSSLISFYLLFSYLKCNRNKYLVGLFTIIFLSVISDRIFIVQTLVSATGICMYYLYKDRNFRPLLCILLGYIAGWVLTEYILPSYMIIPESKRPFSDSQSVTNFFLGFKYIFKHFRIHSFILVFHLVVIIVSPYVVFVSRSIHKPMFLSLMFAGIISFLFPVLAGYMNAVDTFRYLMHSYIFILLLAPVVLMECLRIRRITKISFIVFPIYMIFIGTSFMIHFNEERLNHFLNFKPSYVKLMDDAGDTLKNGVGDYWTSKQFYLFGTNKKRVVAIFKNEHAFVWEANRTWWLGSPGKPMVFNFSYRLKLDSIVGPPLDSVGVYPEIIYLYKDFTFEQDGNGGMRIKSMND